MEPGKYKCVLANEDIVPNPRNSACIYYEENGFCTFNGCSCWQWCMDDDCWYYEGPQLTGVDLFS